MNPGNSWVILAYMDLPEKFRKLLSLLHDQLFYNNGSIVVINETECLAIGLSTAEVKQNLLAMREIGLIGKEKSWMDSKNATKPIGKEIEAEKQKVYVPLFADVDHIDGMHWVLAIPTTPKFNAFYSDAIKSSEKLNDKAKKLDIKFDIEKSILFLDDKRVLIQQKNDKPNAHYILEYIFENEEGLKAKSSYSEILEDKFRNEDKKWRTLYRACQDINKKASEQAGISNFLIIKSGITGYAQINPEYL